MQSNFLPDLYKHELSINWEKNSLISISCEPDKSQNIKTLISNFSKAIVNKESKSIFSPFNNESLSSSSANNNAKILSNFFLLNISIFALKLLYNWLKLSWNKMLLKKRKKLNFVKK